MAFILEYVNLIVATVAAFVLISFCIQHGILRGTLASFFRIVWLVPFICALFPKSIQESLPRSIKTRPIHVLVDDSESMRKPSAQIWSRVGGTIERLQEACERLSCSLEMTNLSSLQDAVDEGYTPLREGLTTWSYSVGNDPWVVISDGGDWRPTLPWPGSLKGFGNSIGTSEEPRGMIVGISEEDENNVWIDRIDAPPFSFEGQAFQLNLTLTRSPKMVEKTQVIQIQVMLEDQSLAALNATFESGSSSIAVPLAVPSLARGQHLLNVRILPTAEENALWDNDSFVNLEVLPNTIGLLHLLGSPSWGGRFLRRYLKAEPKYDMISFFILRDRMDSQKVSERELSLIPFPVDRLFRDELPNFKVVIIQNFAVFDFLEESNQKRLVKFVKDGGGLLFLGGPRALQTADLGSSVLGSILPFDVSDKIKKSAAIGQNPFLRNLTNEDGPYYDQDLNFNIKLAQPDPDKRALANVFDSWEKLSGVFSEVGTLKGMHRTDKVKFKDELVTPLLEATDISGNKYPLAVASYPNKGRAVWIFTDQMWQLAMSDSYKVSRSRYHEFIQGAMSWLLRKEFRQPLVIKQFDVAQSGESTISWSASLQGPAAKYFQSTDSWVLNVCNVQVPMSSVGVERISGDDYRVSGSLNMKVAGGQRCRIDISGEHVAFGSLKTGMTTIVPETFSDAQLSASRSKLTKLAQLTGASFVTEEEEKKFEESTVAWLNSQMQDGGVALPKRFKSSLDYFWVLNQWWVWLLLLALPLEILIRRWPQIFSDYLGQKSLAREEQ